MRKPSSDSMAFLLDSCTVKVLSRELFSSCKPFHCGDTDLDEFFAQDAVPNHEALLGKSYCFVLDADPATIVCAFTLSSDSVHVDHLPNARKKKINSRIAHPKQKRRYPAILIGRLAVNEEFADKGIGSEMLSAIKQFSTDPDNLADCRFLAVDAKNEEKPLHYYEKNDFRYLYSSEEQEAENLDLPLPLKTRFMFFYLIDLKKS